MTSFNLCTYNMGAGAGDYQLLCRYMDPAKKIESQEQQDAFISKYEEVQKKTKDLLINKAAVYFLQEVGDEERPLIKTLKENNFEVIHLNDRPIFNSLIAIDKSRFKDIKNHSTDIAITKYFKKDVAIASAIDIKTGKRIVFASAHVPGFDFQKKYPTDTQEGDLYCKKILKILSQISKDAIQIIGADMNANPEKWMPRFDIFKKHQFKVHRTNTHTNVNPRDAIDQKREIDFIFTKKQATLWKRIKSIFCSTSLFKNLIKKENDFDSWNVDCNASDHSPVFAKVQIKIQKSLIHRIWNKIFCVRK